MASSDLHVPAERSSADGSLNLDDPRVVHASREYLAELESGKEPDRQRFLSASPELRETLEEVFDGIELAFQLQPKPSPPGILTAEPLGDFRILREIGRGGMGIVYEAEQLSLGRRVALKVLPFSAAIDSRQRQRFQIESRAAALLHHSHIVPVYAVGCERGLHYYAMQLIEGGSLADVIRESRAERAATSRNPRGNPDASTRPPAVTVCEAGGMGGRGTTRGRSATGATIGTGGTLGNDRRRLRVTVELIAKVADALEYAHQAGTIHRDIKPANLLLDHSGHIWITDFGLAHVGNDASLTATGDVLGTMRYMSPEQAGGQRAVLDGRTDIYSLGATLYELLTLEPLFATTGRPGLLDAILNSDPRPLRSCDRQIPVELETIVLKCLAKYPAERYATAADLAADLRRYLDERPILARRPTLVDTLRKWARRHPSMIIAAVVPFVLGFIGLAIMTGLIAQSRDRERQRAQEAEARFVLARRAADEMIHVAQNELSNAPFQDGPRKRLLSAALRYYQELIASRPASADMQADLEETRDRVSGILADLAVVESGRHNILLAEPAVLDDLTATDAQRLAIRELSERIRNDWDQLRPRSRIRLDRQQLVERTRDYNQSFATILSDGQRKRLQQIAWQWEGPRAFFDSEIIERLRITAEQQDGMRDVLAQWIGRMLNSTMQDPLSNPFGPPGPEALRTVAAECAKVLTSEQRSLWDEMVGRPYVGPIGPPAGVRNLPFIIR